MTSFDPNIRWLKRFDYVPNIVSKSGDPFHRIVKSKYFQSNVVYTCRLHEQKPFSLGSKHADMKLAIEPHR